MFCKWWYCNLTNSIVLELRLKAWILLGKLVLLRPSGFSVLLRVNCAVDCGLIWWFIWLQHLSLPQLMWLLCLLIVWSFYSASFHRHPKYSFNTDHEVTGNKENKGSKTKLLNWMVPLPQLCRICYKKRLAKNEQEWTGIEIKVRKRIKGLWKSLFIHPSLVSRHELEGKTGWVFKVSKEFLCPVFTCVHCKLSPSSLMRIWNTPG